MKLNRRLSQLTEPEYRHLLTQHRRYTDFNSLGLFRGLLENEKLNLEQRLRLRDAAVEAFPKFYEFLQLKDPKTYFRLNTLGQELTVSDERAAWDEISHAQQRILTQKRIRHRNFGTYAKHGCGYDTCPLNGLMIRQGTRLAEDVICFSSDQRISYGGHLDHRAKQRRRDRKAWASQRNSLEE
ncbi:hypothetical protein [Hymenobacter psychrotolerans]|uniref:Uncharacterized protein n=1 Tax=Hymenobacter psychrotolerans DSM 18569 TaxID=1121959 RepID=A0A1M7ACI8_9BACT|nr:hypothetical protein [Hymenobacter psychrotolerans]SHL40388.1 hypothetical protein SAMN02746009_02680 [Hymenobacter psychrotolerans DSM 18569]